MKKIGMLALALCIVSSAAPAFAAESPHHHKHHHKKHHKAHHENKVHIKSVNPNMPKTGMGGASE